MIEKNVPRLRFPGFKNDWKQKQLGEIGSVINGLTYSPDDIDENGVLVLRSCNVKNGALLFNDNVYVNSLKYNAVKKDDILICVRNGSRNLIGKNALITSEVEGVAFGAFMSIFRSDINNFVFQLFSTLQYYKTINENLGATINSINNSDLVKFKFYFPNDDEQRKVESFLLSIDTQLQNLKRKKSLLEQYKKGMMQKIFNQEIRFKDDDGKDFGAWETSQLKSIATFFSGGTPLTSQPEYYNGEIAFIKSGEISKSKTEQFITEAGFKSSSAKMVRKGDLLFALYGATSGEVAVSKIDGAINQAVLCIRYDGEVRYLHNFLLLQKESILSTYLQGGQGNLSSDIIKSLHVPLPSPNEQVKIANFLSAIDERISLVSQKIEKVEVWKKGLLAEMFV